MWAAPIDVDGEPSLGSGGRVELYANDCVARNLGTPFRVYGGEVGAEEPQVEREVGDQQTLPAEAQAGGKEQLNRLPLGVHAGEVPELFNHPPGRIHDHDLVALVRGDPEVVLVVEDHAIGTIDAVGKHRRVACGRVLS